MCVLGWEGGWAKLCSTQSFRWPLLPSVLPSVWPQIPLLDLLYSASWQTIEESMEDHTSPTHIPLADVHHMALPRCKGAGKCSLVVCQEKGL